MARLISFSPLRLVVKWASGAQEIWRLRLRLLYVHSPLRGLRTGPLWGTPISIHIFGPVGVSGQFGCMVRYDSAKMN